MIDKNCFDYEYIMFFFCVEDNFVIINLLIKKEN